MISLEDHISYLLNRSGLVIVPGFGGFVVKYNEAVYSVESGLWIPPCRVVSFNPELLYNDGSLCQSVARSEGIPYEAAVRLVETTVAAWRSQINAEGELVLDGIGRFAMCGGTAPVYEPENYIAEASLLGLPTFKLPELDATETTAGADDITHRARQLRDRVIRIAASVAVIITLAVGVLSIGYNMPVKHYMASMFAQPVVVTEEPVVSLPQEGELLLALRTDGEVAVDTATVNKPHKYYLIVASLASTAEVDKFMAMASENDRGKMGVLHRDGRYRVYISSGSTFEQANSARFASGNAGRYPDAWVYVLKN